MNITFEGVSLGAGMAMLLSGLWSLLKGFAEMRRDVSSSEMDISILERRVVKLEEKVGLTKSENWEYTENGRDVEPTGLIGKVEYLDTEIKLFKERFPKQ